MELQFPSEQEARLALIAATSGTAPADLVKDAARIFAAGFGAASFGSMGMDMLSC